MPLPRPLLQSTVLVVEDDEVFQRTYTRALAQFGSPLCVVGSSRGVDRSTPPSQIRTCSFPASGSSDE
jgi:ActR/RegA family two-component response regulator